MSDIAVYIGSINDRPHQIFEKQPWERLLQSHDVEVFGSAILPESVRGYYSRYRTEVRTATNPVAKVVNGFRDCLEYLSHRSPDVLMQLMLTETHGPSVALAGQVKDVPTVTRIATDLFHQYRGYSNIGSQLAALGFNHLSGRLLATSSSKNIVLGPYGKSQLLDRGGTADDILIVPPILRERSKFDSTNGMTEEREHLELPLHRKIVFYAGRLSSHKGMEFLADVMESTQQDTEILYVLAGTGSYQDQFDNCFDSDYVRLVGKVPYDQIHKYHRAADIYVHPSPYEGIPLSIIEALSCENPVIAQNAGDISFVTSNIVETPDQMAARILNDNFDSEWLNKKYFKVSINRKNIDFMINSLT